MTKHTQKTVVKGKKYNGTVGFDGTTVPRIEREMKNNQK